MGTIAGRRRQPGLGFVGRRQHDRDDLRVDRRRAGGMIPPLGRTCAKMQEDGLPKALPIDFRPSPFLQRSQSSAL
jgi:hypothetical protein